VSHAHSWRGAALLLAIGLTATVAQLMMTRAFRTGRTLVNASLQYLGIAWAFVFGIFLFDDPVTWMAICGMLLVVGAGIAASMLRSRSTPSVANVGDSTHTL
jgi:S-adenosylmethionine uptake transporter